MLLSAPRVPILPAAGRRVGALPLALTAVVLVLWVRRHRLSFPVVEAGKQAMEVVCPGGCQVVDLADVVGDIVQLRRAHVLGTPPPALHNDLQIADNHGGLRTIDNGLSSVVRPARGNVDRELCVRRRSAAFEQRWPDVDAIERQILGRAGACKFGQRGQPVDRVKQAMMHRPAHRGGDQVRVDETGTANTSFEHLHKARPTSTIS